MDTRLRVIGMWQRNVTQSYIQHIHLWVIFFEYNTEDSVCREKSRTRSIREMTKVVMGMKSCLEERMRLRWLYQYHRYVHVITRTS